MADDVPDEEAFPLYRELRPYCDALDEELLQDLDTGFESGEYYYALSWLIADVLEHDLNVPRNVLLRAYRVLTREDSDEYQPLLERCLLRRNGR